MKRNLTAHSLFKLFVWRIRYKCAIVFLPIWLFSRRLTCDVDISVMFCHTTKKVVNFTEASLSFLGSAMRYPIFHVPSFKCKSLGGNFRYHAHLPFSPLLPASGRGLHRGPPTPVPTVIHFVFYSGRSPHIPLLTGPQTRRSPSTSRKIYWMFQPNGELSINA